MTSRPKLAVGANINNTADVTSPDSSWPAMSAPTPTKPNTSPTHSRRDARSPNSGLNAPTHSGVVAQTTAATPDEMCRSAMATVPLPETNMRNPTGTDANH